MNRIGGIEENDHGFGVAQAIGEVGQRWNLPLSCTKGVGHFRHGRSVGGSRIQLQLQASHWGRRVQPGGRIAGSFQVRRDLQSAHSSAQHTLLSIRYPCSVSTLTHHVDLLIRQGLVSIICCCRMYWARVSITSYESQNVQTFVTLSSSFADLSHNCLWYILQLSNVLVIRTSSLKLKVFYREFFNTEVVLTYFTLTIRDIHLEIKAA